MASRRRFTDLVGCRLPVRLASLGGPIGTPALAAAVSDAGGHGTIPNPSADEVEAKLQSAHALGESVDAVTHPQPAAAIVAELTATL
jgi:NAD(P)H-dependent flavin oxidoreductase YrpB (nitropropane dioxygenase family)